MMINFDILLGHLIVIVSLCIFSILVIRYYSIKLNKQIKRIEKLLKEKKEK